MRLQAYDTTVMYHPGKKMFLADTLSRAYIHGVNQECVDDEDDVKEAEYIPVTDRRLLELRSSTKEDRSMQQLQQVIVEGWPEDKMHLDPEVRPYFSMRNEMTVQDGLIFRGNRVVVPMTQRAVLKEKLHSTHIGIEGCCRRARECLYGPNMNSDIRDYVSKCPTCRKYEVANPVEPFMVHEVPDRPCANGKVESAVKMAKNLFRKAREDKADPYLAMLDHRNTPAKGLLSPAQKLVSRRTKTLLPTREDLLKPALPKNLKKLVKRDSRRQERSFNHKVKPLQPLHPGDVVWMKPHTNGQKEWKKAIVWRRLDERSYHVKVAGELYRRNRVDLKKNCRSTPTYIIDSSAI